MRAMAIVHRAEIRPTKLELLAGWLPGRPWYRGPAGAEFRSLGSFRFDDPAGEVGVETLIVRADGGPALQVPLTYRSDPLDDGEPWLVGSLQHSVLGRRWVYDACGDPVYAAALARTISTGAGEAEEWVQADGEVRRREPTASVRGSGTDDAGLATVGRVVAVDDADPTIVRTEAVELAVRRVLDGTGSAPGAADGLSLTGTWAGVPGPVLLAYFGQR